MPEESDESQGVYQTFHGSGTAVEVRLEIKLKINFVQEVVARQRTRSSSWGEQERRSLDKGREEERMTRQEEMERWQEEKVRREQNIMVRRQEELRAMEEQEELRRRQEEERRSAYYYPGDSECFMPPSYHSPQSR